MPGCCQRDSRYKKNHELIHLLMSTCHASPQKPATVMGISLQPLPFLFRDLGVPYVSIPYFRP